MALGKKNKPVISSSNNKANLIRGGKPYFDALLQLIESAKETFHLQTYIYNDDETGQAIADALKAAVQRNVKVYLLLDGYASRGLPRSFINDLKDAGIFFRFFNPLFKSSYFYFGRRLHHKVAVADAVYALVGGVNITNRYNDMEDHKAWLDFAIHLEGEAAKELCVLCWKTWYNFPAKLEPTPCELKQIDYKIPAEEQSEVAIRRNDWVRRKNEISATYVNMMRTSSSHVTILCSYFLPGRVIRRQLTYASQRGIQIKVVTAGVSDVKVAKYAERYLYNWLLRRNIQLYEYRPNVLHGKIAVCDGEWLTIGSYNINDISAYASIELNINVHNTTLAKETEQLLNKIIEEDCTPITEEYLQRSKNTIKQFLYWCSYEITRGLLFLFTFYFKRKS